MMLEQDDDEMDDEVEYYAIRPNKTQLKRDIAAVFAMAEELCVLTEAQIQSFELPDKIEQAVLDAAKMGHNSAKKRLLKFITAQLRSEVLVESVAERLARLKSRSAHTTREHHQAERWRDALVADSGNEQLTHFLENYPDADHQYLRQLQRNAQKEAREAKPPKSSRVLYKYVKSLIADDVAELDIDEDQDEG